MKGTLALHRFGRWLVPERLRWMIFSAILPLGSIRPQGVPEREDVPVYLVGFFSRVSGLASGARSFRAHFEKMGRCVIPIDLGTTLNHGLPLPDGEPYPTLAAMRNRDDTRGPGTVIVIMDAAYSPLPLWLLGRRFRQSKRLIGLWFWELPQMPPAWRRSTRCFDEIWTCSRFNRKAVQALTPAVRLVEFPRGDEVARRRRFAEDKLRVLFIFNMSANFARKNPLGVIAAFRSAFGRNPGMELVLKVSQGELFPAGLEQLRAACRGAGNIRLIEHVMAEDSVNQLFESSDIYLSLHRAEGLGLTLLDAIRHGLYVVATAWSGNVDFMQDRERCFLVPFELVPVNDPQGIYPRNQQWAEPNGAEAARILCRIAGGES